MAIEDRLFLAYTIGTTRELEKYASKDIFNSHKLSYAYFVEFGMMAASQLLPENIDHFVFAPLALDVATRYVNGMICLVTNYRNARRSSKLLEPTDYLKTIIRQPGVIGRIREIAQRTKNHFSKV
jgi:hypothetical protein